jgi:hypothetical protein
MEENLKCANANCHHSLMAFMEEEATSYLQNSTELTKAAC